MNIWFRLCIPDLVVFFILVLHRMVFHNMESSWVSPVLFDISVLGLKLTRLLSWGVRVTIHSVSRHWFLLCVFDLSNSQTLFKSGPNRFFFTLSTCRLTTVPDSCFISYVDPSISFQTFFRAFKIVVVSWKFSMLLLYISWDDWPIFIISRSNEQLRQQLEYTLQKPDCHSWLISKMQSDILEEWYGIKYWEKMPQKRMECFRVLWIMLHESSISF